MPFEKFPMEWKRYTYGLLSCPFELNNDAAGEIADALQISLEDANGAIEALYDLKILRSGHSFFRLNAGGWGYSGAYWDVFELMSLLKDIRAETLTTLKPYSKIFKREHFKRSLSWSAADVDNYCCILEALIWPDSKNTKDRRQKVDISFSLASTFAGRLFVAATKEGFESSFLIFTPLALQRIEQQFEDFLWFVQPQQDHDRMLATMSAAARAAGMQVSLLEEDDRYLNFWRNGHPREWAAKENPRGLHGQVAQAVLALLDGKPSAAVKLFKTAMKAGFYYGTNKHFFLKNSINWLYGLALYLDRKSATTQKAMQTILKDKKRWDYNHAPATIFCVKALEVKVGDWSEVYESLIHCGGLEDTLAAIAFRFLHLEESLSVVDRTKLQKLINSWHETAERFSVVGQLIAELQQEGAATAEKFEKKLAMKPLFRYERQKEIWEKSLEKLLDFTEAGEAKVKPAEDNAEKIFYYIDTDTLEFSLRLHKVRANGEYTKGRQINVGSFKDGQFDCMTDFDRRVAACVVMRGYSWRPEPYLGGAEAVSQMVGYPYVFDADNPEQRLEVEKGALQLSVVREKSGFSVVTNVDKQIANLENIPEWVVVQPMPNKLTAIPISKEQAFIVQEFRNAGALPQAAEDQLTELVGRLSNRMPVMSDLLKNSEQLPKKRGNNKISLLLAPTSEMGGYAARAVVRPLEGATVVCEPGKGLEYLASSVDGKAVQVHRNLKKEKENFAALETIMQPVEDCREDDANWLLDTEACLKMLECIRENPEVCTVEWPEGVRLKVSKPTVQFEQLNISVRKVGTWFEVEGSVELDGKTRLKVAELLRLVRESSGNFIALGGNEYVALTEGLKKQLATLDKLSGNASKTEISPYNAGVIEELEKSGVKVDADQSFHDLTRRIANAGNVRPSVPETLRAELRDYQVDGFEWMMRLADWGAGALLADDMGLGKTVQTIAVLLARASLGAQLVVVPSSVLFNWRDELTKFAPSLKVEIFNTAEDRAVVLDNLKPGVVVLSTYGVLTGEIEKVAPTQWSTAVFDEAHSIKNKETKAFKAATQLKADFRILLTGTPLQNHLAEIWALFEVAVPGLLGSFSRFADRFVLPIERDKDKEQQRLLKRIVSPFILRRTKTDVLNELPEKTEVTVKVELSDAEKALYEQIREETVLDMENHAMDSMQALRALMKLRQAACSPELVDKKLKLPSSKTQTFLRLVDELIENKHRALVFSQFTSHLALIRRALDEKGISYLYLDGSMSSGQRMKLVEAFESGTMPLFLISLKAGGTGLNLTAADYVIHMDPWWNPAIEDQASDRAYRIGQERPVTIYRLIAAGTVEEKILRLHATKKSLADALLDGTDMSNRLGRDQILELLQLAQ